jgi:hypothetical protein
MSTETVEQLEIRIADLEAELRDRDEKIAELRREKNEADELAGKMIKQLAELLERSE